MRINLTSVLVNDGIPFTSFASDDVIVEYSRLRELGHSLYSGAR
jgi:hypothetical protein